MARHDEHDSDVCTTPGCEAYLPEIKDELCEQADYWGMESLTEQQQVFIEWHVPTICPECIP